jgi:hypothetical protein
VELVTSQFEKVEEEMEARSLLSVPVTQIAPPWPVAQIRLLKKQFATVKLLASWRVEMHSHEAMAVKALRRRRMAEADGGMCAVKNSKDVRIPRSSSMMITKEWGRTNSNQ